MNKKGMTLIELIAVIAIIAILSLMIAPNIIQMRKDSIESNLDVKIEKIHNAAVSYAEDNLSSVPNEFVDSSLNFANDKSRECLESKTFDTVGDTDYSYCEKYCLIVYIGSLVDQGYISGDNEDKTQLLNPIDKSNLNFDRVCVRYDTNIVAKPRYSTENVRKLVAYVVNEGSLYDNIK